MNILHLADLHIGRRLNGFDLSDDQAEILRQILDAAAGDVDAIVVAGDLYNSARPADEAVQVVGEFLTALAALGRPVFLIAGNHDSAEQIAYCRDLLAGSGIHCAGAFKGCVPSYVLADRWGEVRFHLMPYVRPGQVRPYFPEHGIHTFADAAQAVLESIAIDPARRNVLVAHQFVGGGAASDSEERIIGGLEEIPLALLRPFDYVALGHLHSPQTLPGGTVRYAGSPLKYSLSEACQNKSLTIARLDGTGAVRIEEAPLRPLRDLRRVSGTLKDLLEMEESRDFLEIELTDETPPVDPMGALAGRFPSILRIARGFRLPERTSFTPPDMTGDRGPFEHFVEFYTQQHGFAPDEARCRIVRRLLEEEASDETAPA